MSALFNPLEFPICLSAPPRLATVDEGIEHAPFAMLLMDWLRPSTVVGAGSRLRGALQAASHAAGSLGFSTRCVAVPEGSEAVGLLPDGVDLLMLDLRELPDPERALEPWLEKMSTGAVVLVGGISPGGQGEAKHAAWEVFARQYAHFTFEHGGGLGVLAPGDGADPRVTALFGLEDEPGRLLRALFAALGGQLSRKRGTSQELLHLELEVKEKTRHLAELSGRVAEQQHELSTIHDSLGFRLVKGYWATREAALPPNTRSGLVYQSFKQGLKRVASGADRLLGPRRRTGAATVAPAVVSTGSDAPWTQPLGEISRASQGDRVLIVAELSIPQCRRYRVQQKVDMLRTLGREATVVSWTDEHAARSALQLCGLVIFYRVPAVPAVEGMIAEARRLGIPSFFDIDDLVFDVEEYAANSNLQQLAPAERDSLLDGARLYRRALSLCDHAIASTPTLATRMRRANAGTVHVVENGLDAGVLAVAAEQVARHPAAAADTVTIGYGSGTRTHDADFQVAAEGLLDVLERYPQVRLVIHGYLQLPAGFERFADRLLRIPFLDAEDYLRAVASWDISVAPLEPSVFNDAKSNIKYLEASVFGVPSVCSPCAAFRQVVEPGVNGMLATTRDEWLGELSRLVEDADLRRRLGERARKTVLDQYSPHVIARKQLQPILEAARAQPSNGLRVLEVNVFFAPLSFGGATIVAEEVARGLHQEGLEVTVVTGVLNSELPDHAVVRYEVNGLPVVAVQLPRGGGRALEHENPEMTRLFGQVLAAARPEVVHFHSIQLLSASLADACIAAGVPYVITLHDAWWLCEKQFMVRDDGNYCFQRGIDLKVCSSCVQEPAFTFRRSHGLRKILDAAALLLTPSEFQRQLYIDNGIPPEHIQVNKNGILLPAQAPPPRKLGPALRFAYLGGRAHHKGYFWLKEIFESIPEGGYVLSIVDVQRRLGVSLIEQDHWKVAGRVDVIPPYDQEGLDAFFADIDVLLLPSKWKESFGLTVREAVARNVWVITTDSGGAADDVVEGVNGNVLQIGDTDGFRAAIRALLANPARLQGYVNPRREAIRGFAEQVRELKGMLAAVAQPAAAQPVERLDVNAA